jgi:hypothetical protein
LVAVAGHCLLFWGHTSAPRADFMRGLLERWLPGRSPLKRIVQGYKRQQCKLVLHCNTACESDAAD